MRIDQKGCVRLKRNLPTHSSVKTAAFERKTIWMYGLWLVKIVFGGDHVPHTYCLDESRGKGRYIQSIFIWPKGVLQQPICQVTAPNI